MHESLFYVQDGVLSQSELISARLDGLLFEVGVGYMPADLPEDADARVSALAPLLAPGFAASGPTAAWVHGVGDAAPVRHHLHRAAERRPRVKAQRDVVVHESWLPPEDVVMVAQVPVTSRVRTLTDLVLGVERYPEYRVWIDLVAREMPILLQQVYERLSGRQRLPGRRAALALVARLADENAQEVVTR